MKNKFTKQLFVSITLIFSLLLIQSCQTENDESISLQPESNKVSLSEKVDSETRETLNIDEIKTLNKNNPISLGLINEIKKNNIGLDKLDTDNINYISFLNTDVNIISIGTDNPNNKIIAYEFNGKYSLLRSSKVENLYNIQSLDKNDFIKVIENKSPSLEFVANSSVNSFSNYVYSEQLLAHKSSSYGHRTEDTCCRNYNYTGCVNCTVGGNGLVWILLGAIAPEINVAIMVSCIGAGPDAWC